MQANSQDSTWHPENIEKILYCPNTMLVIIYKALWKKIIVWHSHSSLRRNIPFSQQHLKHTQAARAMVIYLDIELFF